MLNIPAYKIYPNDSFDQLFHLPNSSSWDTFDIVFSLRNILEVELDDTKVPEGTAKMAVGRWIKELLLRCFP